MEKNTMQVLQIMDSMLVLIISTQTIMFLKDIPDDIVLN